LLILNYSLKLLKSFYFIKVKYIFGGCFVKPIVMGKNVLITGGSGLIGKELTKLLKDNGYEVSWLSTTLSNSADVPVYNWNIKTKSLDEKALVNADYIVHLAGANIGEKRWSRERKEEIVDSRVKSAEMLYYSLKSNKHNVKAVISASAIGYYGDTGDRTMSEETVAGFDFLANTCRAWEHAINKIGELGIRTVNIRNGMVLSSKGGALPVMVTPIRLLVGAPLGTGEQWVSWIHIDDLCKIYLKAIEDETVKGPYNGVSPNPATNKDLTRSIAKILDKPLWLPPIPASVLKTMIGEKASIVLSSCKASSEKIARTGINFKHPILEEALETELRKE